MSSADHSNPVQRLLAVAQSIARSKKVQNQLIADIEGARSSETYSALAGALEALTLQDLGLSDLNGCFDPGMITLVNVFSRKDLWIGVFCMAKGTSFPLHDHPDMIGVTRVFLGSVQRRCLDITSYSTQATEARLVVEGESPAPCSFFLTPNIGNLHRVDALEDSVLLDLFVPNYSKSRVCSFFEEVEQTEKAVVLRRTSQPEIPCQERPYSGLPLT